MLRLIVSLVLIFGISVPAALAERTRRRQAERDRESVQPGRKTPTDMAQLYDVSQPTVSRIVSEYSQQEEGLAATG